MTYEKDLDDSARQTNRHRLLLGVSFLAALIVGISALPLEAWLEHSAGWIDANPFAGGLLFVVLFVVLTVAMIPGSILVLSGGYLFGMYIGAPLSWLGVILGAALSAYVSRTIARGWLTRRFEHDSRFLAIDSAVARRGFMIVALTRLSLIVPFNVLNVIYGLSRIPIARMVAATALGMIPAVALYTYLGTVAKNINQLFSGDLDRGWTEEVIVIFGLCMVAIVTYVVHRTATTALKRELQDTEG